MPCILVFVPDIDLCFPRSLLYLCSVRSIIPTEHNMLAHLCLDAGPIAAVSAQRCPRAVAVTRGIKAIDTTWSPLIGNMSRLNSPASKRR